MEAVDCSNPPHVCVPSIFGYFNADIRILVSGWYPWWHASNVENYNCENIISMFSVLYHNIIIVQWLYNYTHPCGETMLF